MHILFSRKQTAAEYSSMICLYLEITININRIPPEFRLAERTPDAAELATAS